MTNLYHILPTELTELQNRLAEIKEGLDLSDFVNQRPQSHIDDNGIAHIYITGALMDNAPRIYKMLGCTDYRDIQDDIEIALTENVSGILFHIDSGGGTVAGCQETATIIQNLTVPSVTHYDGMGCSAAYKLGVGADYIVSTQSSTIGNVGTILAFMDYSEAMQKAGYKIITITNDGAELKDTFHKLPLTDEQKEFLQDEINQAGLRFQNHVETNRPNLDPIYKKAGWYSGERAIELGFADELGGADLAYQRLTEIIDVM